MAVATKKQVSKREVQKATPEWERIAMRPPTASKLRFLLAAANVSRATNDKLFIYDLCEQIVDKEWALAKANGLVSDAMIRLDEAFAESGQPVYTPAEDVA